MFNILPHLYQRIGKWLIIISIVIPFTQGVLMGTNWNGSQTFGEQKIEQVDSKGISTSETYNESTFEKVLGHLTNTFIVIGILLYFISKDKIQDEYIDMLKLKSVSIVFIVSAVIGFIFHNIATSLIFISLFQVGAYIVILKCFKKFSV